MAGHPERRGVSVTSGSHCYSGQRRDHLCSSIYNRILCLTYGVRACDITLL